VVTIFLQYVGGGAAEGLYGWVTERCTVGSFTRMMIIPESKFQESLGHDKMLNKTEVFQLKKKPVS